MAAHYMSMAGVRDANKRAGNHFFDRSAMRFFASRIESGLYGGRFFITSEQFQPSSGPAAERRYTIREALATGEIRDVGEFQAHGSKEDARDECRRLASQRDGDETELCPGCSEYRFASDFAEVWANGRMNHRCSQCRDAILARQNRDITTEDAQNHG